MIPWLTPYTGIWAMTEPCARLMAMKVSALVNQATTVEQFARLQADARPDLELDAWPDFVEIRAGIAVLTMAGVLSKERLLSGPPSLLEHTSAIQRATVADSIHTLVLKIDSPGGSVAGLDAAAAAVRAAREQMRAVSFIDDCACSAAYWIASQAEEIITNPTAAVGSIGAYSVLVDSSEAARRAGYEVVVFSSGEVKGLGESGTSLDETQRAEMQQRIDSLGALFVEAVASGRGLGLEAVQKLHTGQVWIGQQAVDLGLVDRVARFDEFLIELAEDQPRPFSKTLQLPETEEETSMSDNPTEAAADEQGLVQRLTQNILQTLGLAEQPSPQATESQAAGLLRNARSRVEELRNQQAVIDIDATLRSLDSKVTPAAQNQLREVLLKLHQSDPEALAQVVGALEHLPDLQLFAGEMASEKASGEPRLPSQLSTSEREYLKVHGIDEARDQALGNKYRNAYGAMN